MSSLIDELFDPELKRREDALKDTARGRDNGESLFQTAVANWLREACPGLLWFAVPNENKQLGVDKNTRAWLLQFIPGNLKAVFQQKMWDAKQQAAKVAGAERKRMGCLKGTHDLMFILDNGMAASIELKWDDGRVSDEQEAFKEAMQRRGCRTAFCWTGEEVEATIRSWGIVPKWKFPMFNKDSKKQLRQQASDEQWKL